MRVIFGSVGRGVFRHPKETKKGSCEGSPEHKFVFVCSGRVEKVDTYEVQKIGSYGLSFWELIFLTVCPFYPFQ